MSKKLKIIVVSAVLFVGLGVGGYFFLSKGKAEAKEEHKEEEEIDYAHADQTMVTIEEDTYSLSSSGEFAKMGISIRVKHEESALKLQYHLPEIKSEMVKEFSKLNTENLRGDEGFEFTRKKVEEIIQKYIEKEEYSSVSVTSLKLQN